MSRPSAFASRAALVSRPAPLSREPLLVNDAERHRSRRPPAHPVSKSIGPVKRRSANAARLFGIIMIVLIGAWDVDAMRPHIAAHSWATLAFVSLFLVVHLSDYLTVGRLVNRINPLLLASADEIARGLALPDARQEDNAISLSGLLARPRTYRLHWRRFFPIWQPQPSRSLGRPTAKLYTFTAVTAAAAQASGAPYPITQQYFVVKAE
jgi:hypothetical protein